MCSLPSENLFPAKAENTRVVGASIAWSAETDSTNTLALECCRDGAVFIADAQRAGRGRHGRHWHSSPGLGLWFSIALRGPLPGVSFAAALAVRDAVADAVALTVKWPNDLYWGNRKVCGILVEQRDAWLALGIGLNVNHAASDFPPLLRHRAASLAQAAGRTWDRVPLLLDLLSHLDAAVARLRQGEGDRVRADWIAACDIVGRRIRRGTLRGLATAVDNDGALIVQTRDGLRRITCGDVSIDAPPESKR